MISPPLSFLPPPCVLSHLLIQSSLMLTRLSLSNVFGGGQVLLSFLKIEALCLLAAGRKASLPGGLFMELPGITPHADTQVRRK